MANTVNPNAVKPQPNPNGNTRATQQKAPSKPPQPASLTEAVQTALDADQVTLSENPAPRPEAEDSNRNALADFFRNLRQGATRGEEEGGLKSLFSSLRAQKPFSQSMNTLLGDLDNQMSQIFRFSPKESQQLSLLIGMLAHWNPEGAEKLLQQVSNSLAQLGFAAGGKTVGEMAAQKAAEMAPVQPPTPQQATEQVEMVHMSLDFELTQTTTLRSEIAELKEQGFNVKTTEITHSQTVKIHLEFTAIRQQRSDPLVLDLKGDGIDLTGLKNGADFDINADGKTDRTAFVQGDDAFLALDRNGNGRIDDGGELFGDQHGAANGFEELKRYDDNGDGKINTQDSIYDQLRALHDKNGDGRVDATETSRLREVGVFELDLGYTDDVTEEDEHGNLLAQRSAYTRQDGKKGGLADAWLRFETRA